MRITVLEHLAHEGSGVLGEVLDAAGADWHVVRLHAGDAVPADADALVVLGGDMNTDEADRYPHLTDEVALLRRLVPHGVPVLGICLGAQLLAEATGGAVTHGQAEIGYPPVTLTAEGRRDPLLGVLGEATPTFNAHGDHIAVGPEATVLASSAATRVHAFRVGRAVGVQFHPEIDAAFVMGYVAAPGVEAYLGSHGWTGARLLAEARARDAEHRAMGARLLGRWVELASAANRRGGAAAATG
jgi:GMP synthase-like glutamine amidotransferase